jgi:hypothetical protein
MEEPQKLDALQKAKVFFSAPDTEDTKDHWPSKDAFINNVIKNTSN